MKVIGNRVHPNFAALTLNPSLRTEEGFRIRFPISLLGEGVKGMRANVQNWNTL
jgi:hypothetical protein